MKTKVLVVGLTPEYYPSTVKAALSDNQSTMRSTNMGAAFITRSIMSIFDADYLDITSNFTMSTLKNDYDLCVVSLASHLGPSRDVRMLVDFLKKIDIKAVFLSGGLDAGQSGVDGVSNSVRELIDLCSRDNQWVGVRGYASALYLIRQGLRNVVPIGCPTMYSKFSGPISSTNLESRADIAVPFHWSIAASILGELSEHRVIGQDCIDEEIFLGSNANRISKNIAHLIGMPKKIVQHKLLKSVTENGVFPESYDSWYEEMGSQKAILSGRLHAAICGLTQGVPTVISSWDLRTSEIIDYFKMPNITPSDLQKNGSLLAMRNANFEAFNLRQIECWSRWNEFLRQSNLMSTIQGPKSEGRDLSGIGKCLSRDYEGLLSASYLHPQIKGNLHKGVKRLMKLIDKKTTRFRK